MPADGEVSLGKAETHAKQETEREIAARLAALEAIDPSQKRPTPRPNILGSVAFTEL
jgi:ribosome maturation protein Sdo1